MSLHEALLDVARTYPDVRAEFPSVGESIGYADLAASATRMAGALIEGGVRPGDRVGLLCPNAPEFLRTLFAISMAGAAACPLSLPWGLRDTDGYLRRLSRIVEVAGMRAVVVSHRFGPLAQALGTVPVTWFDSGELEQVGSTAEPGWSLPTVSADDLAIVQFTSGSTALPKGVRLTHRNVLAGLDAISQGIALGPTDGGGFWLPLFHDMGLFGTLSAVLTGIPAHVWSPVSFIKSPGRWLREFLASGATISAMPNFGYDLLTESSTVDKVLAEGLDLGRWRIAFNGAEPVNGNSVRAFLDRFAPAGFRPEAMFPVYGMAEATLAVAFPPLGRPPLFERVDRNRLAGDGIAIPVPTGQPAGREVAGVGRPVAGMRLRIVDPDTGVTVADGRVGEIHIQGASVTAGYLGGEDLAEGWLPTGDLGYTRAGEVFVTGRRKEMVIVRGGNFYPQDVEEIARAVPGVYKGRCVAVAGLPDAGEDTSEQMMLVVETALIGAAAEELVTALRRRVSVELGLAEVDVRLVPARSLPRTSSGKFQRLAARDQLASASMPSATRGG